jgi:hypothetical protein
LAGICWIEASVPLFSATRRSGALPTAWLVLES